MSSPTNFKSRGTLQNRSLFLFAFGLFLAIVVAGVSGALRSSAGEGSGVRPSISITTLPTTITQNFDTLATSGTANPWTDDSTLPGWFSQFTAVTTNPTTYRADAGGSNTGAIYSWGTGTSTERAFGSASSATPGTIYNALKLTNNTGSTITSLDISFNGEQWRNGGNTSAQTLAFQFQVASAGTITDANTPTTGWTAFSTLDFVSPTVGATAAALDGNAAANRTAKSANLPLAVNAGDEVWLRWVDINDAGNDHGLGIDDFSVTANGVATPSPSPTPTPSPTPSPSPTPTPTPALLINDVAQVEGNSGTSSFTFTVSLSLPALAGGVTFNVDTADGTATIADNDYVAVHGTGATIDEGLSSTTVTVPVNGDTTPDANETFFVNISSVTGAGVTDAQGQGTIANDDGVGSPSVVISQVYGGGGNSGATYKNDFIELYNRGATPVDLTGWSVQDTGAINAFALLSAQNTPLTTNLSGTIQPGHYYLIQEAAGANTSGTAIDLPTPDLTGLIAMGATAGKVALVNNTTVLSGNCPAFAPNGIVDFVGYGAADCAETAPTAVLTNTTAAIRNQNGCMDIDYNALDFSVGGPTPRNSSTTNTCAGSGVLSASGSANPNSIEPGGSTLLAVAVSPGSAPASTGITLTGNLSTIGGSLTQQFYDDGTHGDLVIGDNVFSFFATSAANTATGAKSLPISVTDAQARNASSSITMSIVLPTCGVERWSVKVGTDPDASMVDLTKATPVTLATMRGWTAPASPPLNARVGPYETTVWVVHGTLINYKQEGDVDYHAVIQDGAGNTLITEIPCPCCGIGSPFQSMMANARSSFDSRLTASTFFQNPNIPVRITGVGFFDFIHGQTGVAPNGIEIHSVLSIAFPTQQSASTGAGSNVTVHAGDVTIRFANVSESGSTTVTPIDPSTAGPAAGNNLVGPAFNISTTASSSGPYYICISVPYITDPVAFRNLKVLHNEGGVLVDRTTGQDFINKMVCGNSPTLSPFVVALGSTPTAADGSVSGHIVDITGVPISGVGIRLGGTQNRLTITDAAGNYHFDNVETNGFYTVMPSRANYRFDPSAQSFSALGHHIDATFNAAYTGEQANPLDTTEYFVRQQYLDFLGREPEEAGFTGWVNTINNCARGDSDQPDRNCDRVHVSEMFFRSLEFQQRGYFLYRFYSTSFGRKPDFAEFAADLKRVNGFLTDVQLESAKAAFTNDFMTRPAFAAEYNSLTNAAYVDTLINTAAVNLSNRQSIIDALNAGTQTRAAVLRQIAESADVYRHYYNQAFVVMEYFGYLQRDPDALYLDWIVVLDANPTDSRRMVEGFVNATEYRRRFVR
ncbi:MAG TPA: lamin tail domain-containing protein [Pyrinomonadaceae bacterium]|nr:lamin tail domain-containing protein [Pyrinomonadaceae bacterium]